MREFLRFMLIVSRLRWVFRSTIALSLAALVAVASMCSDARADTYFWTGPGNASAVTSSVACLDVSTAYTASFNDFATLSEPRNYGRHACSGPHDGVVGHSFTITMKNFNTFATVTHTVTLASVITDPVIEPVIAESSVLPDMARRISSYPVGEVVVMCAALLMFALGFRSGQSS